MTERIELLDHLDAEFVRVAAAAERRSRRRPGARARTLTVALGIGAMLAGTAYAVPATRTAVDDIAGSFSAWVSGDGDSAPGRALEPGDRAPTWFRDSAAGDARLIAETDGVGLYVRAVDSDRGRWLEFGLGEGLVMGGSLESWRERLGQHAVVLLGTALFGPRDVLDGRGRAPLLGVATRDVKRVELRYASGAPLIGDVGDGGFVLLVDAWRPLRELVAYDAAGRVLERSDVSRRDLSYLCEKEPVCPSDASSSAP